MQTILVNVHLLKKFHPNYLAHGSVRSHTNCLISLLFYNPFKDIYGRNACGDIMSVLGQDIYGCFLFYVSDAELFTRNQIVCRSMHLETKVSKSKIVMFNRENGLKDCKLDKNNKKNRVSIECLLKLGILVEKYYQKDSG